ncbi:MAG: hypothetical protein ACLR7U_12425 [Ruthenibacterium lactatiformans]
MRAGEAPADKGRVVDLIAPIAVLIFCCVVGMVYSGGLFAGGKAACWRVSAPRSQTPTRQ